MGSFGENLRREREMRGISLDEIAGSTKISVRFLQAMENDVGDAEVAGVQNMRSRNNRSAKRSASNKILSASI